MDQSLLFWILGALGAASTLVLGGFGFFLKRMLGNADGFKCKISKRVDVLAGEFRELEIELVKLKAEHGASQQILSEVKRTMGDMSKKFDDLAKEIRNRGEKC